MIGMAKTAPVPSPRPRSWHHSAMPRVSYVVTVYNKETALPFVIAGLYAQEGDFEREFIFVDDESSDGSVDVVRALTRDWANVTIVEQKNGGPATAFATNGMAVFRTIESISHGALGDVPWRGYLPDAWFLGCGAAVNFCPSFR